MYTLGTVVSIHIFCATIPAKIAGQKARRALRAMQVRPAGLAKAWPWRSVTPWRYVLGSRESQSLAQDDCEGTASAMWHDGAPRRIARPKPRRSRGAHAHLHFPQLGTVALEKPARKRLRAPSMRRGLSSRKPPPLVPRAVGRLARSPYRILRELIACRRDSLDDGNGAVRDNALVGSKFI